LAVLLGKHQPTASVAHFDHPRFHESRHPTKLLIAIPKAVGQGEMRKLGLVLLALFLFVPASEARPRANPAPQHWVGSWSTPQQIPEQRNALPPDALTDATLRQIVHISIGGRLLRVHLTNVFGTAPLHATAAHIARPGAVPGSIDVATDRRLTFSGRADVWIPAGAEYISDPVPFEAPALSELAITLHYENAPVQQTSHPGSRETSFYLRGDHVSDAMLAGATEVDHWFQIEGVDVLAPASAAAVIAFGDSITDGRGSTTNGNDRWSDVLARRLQALPATANIAVLNKGIGGGRVLLDELGPSALARFDRDVLAPAGVKWMILLEGINDLGVMTRDQPVSPEAHAAMVASVVAGYEQIVTRAHTHGIKVFGATITPSMGFAYYHPDAQNEADRQAVNAWIRTPGHFDAVIDFDAAVRDPAAPSYMLPALDTGDHLHPNPKGYQAMADAIPLALFGAWHKPAAHRGHRN
jgi:lysophospholipase L1-like esterase